MADTMAYLSSCGYPPVLSSHTSAVSKYQNRTFCPSSTTLPFLPPTLCFLPSFFLSHFFLFSFAISHGLGKHIQQDKRKMVEGTEKEERQLDGHGLEIMLHVFTHNAVCTSFSLRPHFFLSPSPRPSLSFDIFTSFCPPTSAITTATKCCLLLR